MKNRTLAPLLALIVLSVTAAPALAGHGYENVTSKFGEACKSTPCPGGQFNKPTAIAVNDETEEVYVLDSGNDRVEAFNKEHKFQFEFDGSGKDPAVEGKAAGSGAGETPTGKFLKPGGIAVDQATGDVYVADTGPGHEVVDKFSATGEYLGQLTGTCTVEGKTPPTCEESTFVPFVGLKNVTVDGAGDVWVYEGNGPVEGNGVISTQADELSDTGSAMAMHDLVAGGDETPGTESEFPGFAVDSGSDVFVAAAFVYEFAGGERKAVTSDASGLATLAVIAANNNLLVDQGSSIELFKSPVLEGASPLFTFPATGLSESAGIAVNGAKGEGTIYATERGKDDVDVFASAPPEAPEVISESASSVSIGEGKLEAVINPENRTTKYYFEYASTEAAVLAEEGEKVSGEAEVPAEFGNQLASSPVIELGVFNRTIYYRVVAENEESKGTPAVGAVESYTKIPLIAESEEKLSELTSTSVTLEAGIDPVFVGETKYAFEYATGEHAKELLEEGKGTVIHGTTGIHQLEKLAELKKLEEKLNIEEKEREGAGLPLLGRVPICPGVVEEGGTGAFPEEAFNKPCPLSAEIFGLQPGHTYYYRVTAKNSVTEHTSNANKGNPAAGEIKAFTPYAAPTAITGEAQNITGTAATLSGEVNPEDTTATYHFAYITKTGYNEALKNGAANPSDPNYQEELAKGAPNPYLEGETTETLSLAAGSSPQTVGPIPATDLLPGVTYHYALVAVNKYAIQTIGPDRTFTTQGGTSPLVSTGGASNVSQNTATLSGTVTTNGLQTNYGFEIGTDPVHYGPATGLGAIGGAATETVSVTLSKLQPGTTYYYRITATNADGTKEGQPASFTTPAFPTLLAPLSTLPLVATPNIAFPKEEKPSTTTKPLTNEQKLAKALKQCKKDKSKSKRLSCEKAAHKKYPTAKAKKRAHK